MCCVCLSDLGHKATCFVERVFSVFLDNLMLEFFQNGQDVSTVGLSEGPQVGRERDRGEPLIVAGVLGSWSVGWMGRRWGLGVG